MTRKKPNASALALVLIVAALTGFSARTVQAETINYSIGAFSGSAGGNSYSFSGSSGSFDIPDYGVIGGLPVGSVSFTSTSSPPTFGTMTDFSKSVSLSIDSVAEGTVPLSGYFEVVDYSPSPGVNLRATVISLSSITEQYTLADGGVLSLSFSSESNYAVGGSATSSGTLLLVAEFTPPTAPAVPEPSSLILVGLGGLTGLGLRSWRKSRPTVSPR